MFFHFFTGRMAVETMGKLWVYFGVNLISTNGALYWAVIGVTC